MLLDPKRATIKDVQPFPDEKFGYEITFLIEGAIVKEKFWLNDPWKAWIFAQILDLCEEADRPEKLLGQDVWVIISEGMFEGTLVAVSKKEEGCYFYPFYPFGAFKMDRYSIWQLKRDWAVE